MLSEIWDFLKFTAVCFVCALAALVTFLLIFSAVHPDHKGPADCRLSSHDCGYGDNDTNGDH